MKEQMRHHDGTIARLDQLCHTAAEVLRNEWCRTHGLTRRSRCLSQSGGQLSSRVAGPSQRRIATWSGLLSISRLL